MDEERIGLFLDFENLAIGARDHLGGAGFDFGPIADALAERGRVVVRRAYADWSMFSDDRRNLTKHHIELIEIPQRMGARKNAADIKMAVDALELSFERDYVTTFVICTGDSDFTPLVHKLRERNKRVIGIGVEGSTSKLLPPACDEFLFYDRLEGVPSGGRRPKSTRRPAKAAAPRDDNGDGTPAEMDEDLDRIIVRTLTGMKRSTDSVLSSQLKRTLIRKDPTFDESEHGFRSFGELMRNMAERKVVDLRDSSSKGDPEVDLPRTTPGEQEAFDLLAQVVEKNSKAGIVPLSGLKHEMRKTKPRFTEKRFGYAGFLQFAKAAKAREVVEMDWDEKLGDYVLTVAAKK